MEPPFTPEPIHPDSALIHQTLQGKVDAFGTLVARHRDGLYHFIVHTVGDEAEAQDLAQDAFVRAFAALPRFRAGANFAPWIYAIAANLCRDHFRQSKRRPQSLDTGPLAHSLPSPSSSDPALAAERSDERRRLRAAIGALPVEQRMVVVLRHLRSHSYQEMAQILGIPVSTIEHRLRAARQSLRRQLEQGGQ